MTCEGHSASSQEILCKKGKLSCTSKRREADEPLAAARAPGPPEAGAGSLRVCTQSCIHTRLPWRQMLCLLIWVLWVRSALGRTCFLTDTTGLKMECWFSTQKRSQTYVWGFKCITTIHNFFQANLVSATFSNLGIPSRKCSELKLFSYNFVLTLEKKKIHCPLPCHPPTAAPPPQKNKNKNKKTLKLLYLVSNSKQILFIYLFLECIS